VDKLTSSLGEAECALARYVYESIIKDIAHYRAVCLSEAENQLFQLDPKPQSASLRSLDWGYE
jgi:hypothetical protein